MERINEFLKKNPEIRVEFMASTEKGKISVKMSRENTNGEEQYIKTAFREDIMESSDSLRALDYMYETMEELDAMGR